jgi:uncharacterized membrane protein YhaH (DUF805 family)
MSLALAGACLAVELLGPEKLWIPGSERTVQMAAVIGRPLLMMALAVLVRLAAAFYADRITVRGTRHAPVLLAGALTFSVAWLLLTRSGPAGGGHAAAIAADLGFVIASAALPGTLIAAGRRRGVMGRLAPIFLLASMVAPRLRDALDHATDGSAAPATALPAVAAGVLLALAWPRGGRTPLGSPPAADVSLGKPPPGARRAFWIVVLVAWLGRPTLVQPNLEMHVRHLGDVASSAFWSTHEWGFVIGGAVYLLVNRSLPLRAILPASLVASAAALFLLRGATEPSALARAGLVLGATDALALSAGTHLMWSACRRGREAWTFAVMNLLATLGGGLIFGWTLPLDGPGAFDRLPFVACGAIGIALAALQFAPRELLDEQTLPRWPERN